MKKFFSESLQHKIMSLLICITVIPMLVLGIFIYFYSSKMVEKDFIENSNMYIRQISNNLDGSLKNMEMITMMAFTDKKVREVLRMDSHKAGVNVVDRYSYMEQFLANTFFLRKDISGIYIFSDNAVYSQYVYGQGVDFDYKYKEDGWYKKTLQEGGALVLLGTHRRYQSKMMDDYVFSLARCIVDTAYGDILGVILVDANFKLISELCDSKPNTGKGWTIITDKEGKIIYSPDRSELTREIDMDISILNENSGNRFVEKGNERLFMSFITSEYSGWKIIRFIPRKVVYETTTIIGIFIMLSVVTLIILTVTLSFFVSSGISKPIINLNTTLRKIGKGEFNQINNIKRLDEIGQLSNGVNDMMLNLKELIRRVSDAQLKQKEAELMSLQNQINPHFLNNTLNSIQMLAKINRQEKIAQMIDDIGMLFKISMNKGQDIVKLSQEFEHVELYIKLQKIRYADKINYSIQADENIMDLYTIKLILQPIVENAIYHGLEKKKGRGTLKIEGRIEEDHIILSVEDDGVGIDSEHLRNIKNALNGKGEYDPKMMNIGIKNVNERLKLCFGDEFGVYIDSVFGEGTIVRIKLPVIDSMEENSVIKLRYF